MGIHANANHARHTLSISVGISSADVARRAGRTFEGSMWGHRIYMIGNWCEALPITTFSLGPVFDIFANSVVLGPGKALLC